MKGSTKRAALILTVLVVVGLFCLLALPLAGKPEPTVRGMSLTQWLVKSQRLEVGEGIAEAGPRAIPFLIEKVEARESMVGSLYRKTWARIPISLRKRLSPPRNIDNIRENALQGLREFGEEAESALPAILNFLTNGSPLLNKSVAMEAALSIGRGEPEVAVVFRQFMADAKARPSATVAIYYSTYYPEDILSSLLPLDFSDPANPPLNDLIALSVMGMDAASAVPELMAGLANPEMSGAQGNLLAAIAGIGPEAAPLVPHLLEQLEQSSPLMMAKIVEALMNIGAGAAAAQPTIEKVLSHEDAGVRALAAAALVKIGGATERAMPVLVNCLTNRAGNGSAGFSPMRRYGLDHYGLNTPMTAAWLLGDLAPHSKMAVPALKEVLSGNQPNWLKVVAARAIWRLEGDAAHVLPVFRTALTDPANEVRVLACVTLAEMGESARPAIPDLEAACKLSLNTRRAARETIARISTTTQN